MYHIYGKKSTDFSNFSPKINLFFTLVGIQVHFCPPRLVLLPKRQKTPPRLSLAASNPSYFVLRVAAAACRGASASGSGPISSQNRKNPRFYKRGSVAALAIAGYLRGSAINQVVQIKRCELVVLHHCMRLLSVLL